MEYRKKVTVGDTTTQEEYEGTPKEIVELMASIATEDITKGLPILRSTGLDLQQGGLGRHNHPLEVRSLSPYDHNHDVEGLPPHDHNRNLYSAPRVDANCNSHDTSKIVEQLTKEVNRAQRINRKVLQV